MSNPLHAVVAGEFRIRGWCGVGICLLGIAEASRGDACVTEGARSVLTFLDDVLSRVRSPSFEPSGGPDVTLRALVACLSCCVCADFGLRALKSVLVMAGGLKRASPEFDESTILMRALRDMNMPKFVYAGARAAASGGGGGSGGCGGRGRIAAFSV
eukprot:4291999-Pleurochrysis_carterae.AAC.3